MMTRGQHNPFVDFFSLNGKGHWHPDYYLRTMICTVGCGHCRAIPGQPCRSGGKIWLTSRHGTRVGTFQTWRKSHPAEYNRKRLQAFTTWYSGEHPLEDPVKLYGLLRIARYMEVKIDSRGVWLVKPREGLKKHLWSDLPIGRELWFDPDINWTVEFTKMKVTWPRDYDQKLEYIKNKVHETRHPSLLESTVSIFQRSSVDFSANLGENFIKSLLKCPSCM